MRIDGKRVFVTGHRGLVGSAIVRHLHQNYDATILTATRYELDLRDPFLVNKWFAENRPEIVIHVAGTVGGIHANMTRPADFIHDNTMIHSTVLRSAHEQGVEKLLYLGSSCIYPRECRQPIKEEYLLSGALEPTNEPYAIAKISGLISCQSYRRQYGCNFICGMPTNLYGPNDNFDLDGSHVLPALIRKFHDAKLERCDVVEVWGSGTPRREFLHVDDLASACLFLVKEYEEPEIINIGTGTDVTIRDLAARIQAVTHPVSKIRFDSTKPDGTPRKLLDVSRLHALGWRHSIELDDGIAATYDWFCDNQESVRLGQHQVLAT